jgi:hypothetical protein
MRLTAAVYTERGNEVKKREKRRPAGAGFNEGQGGSSAGRPCLYLVELSFGHRRCDGSPLPPQAIVAAERGALQTPSSLFFGGQLLRCTGAYLTAERRILLEPCTVVRAYAPGGILPLERLRAVARRIAASLEQEGVLLLILRLDGSMSSIDAR